MAADPQQERAAGTRIDRGLDIVLPVLLLGCLVVLLVPLPSAVLDVLLSINIALGVMMLLSAVQVRSPLEFSVFPTLLLATTLGRLVLNVASTRLILSHGASDGMAAAGGVIRAFSEFVTGDRLAVGIIMFLILVVIQFVVITQGATRIGEVAARFALDGMPGRQMAVDADLQAGTIDAAEAKRRRAEIQRQSDFYSTMDGAGKFIRGDAVAGLVITAVNIVGGLYVGLVESRMSFGQAVEVYTRLTIGDGLVSQFPALLVSLAAGVLLSRSTLPTDLSRDTVRQTILRAESLAITGVFLLLLILTSLPKLPLLILGAGCLALAHGCRKADAAAVRPTVPAPKTDPPAPAKSAEAKIDDVLQVDPLELELGIGLLRLADPQRGGDLLNRVQHVRQTIAGELGMILPKVRMRDNVRLDRYCYRIKLSDAVVAEGIVQPTRLMAIDWGEARGRVSGEAVREPAFGAPAVWVEIGDREEAERHGYTVVEPASVIATHLTQVIRKHAADLLTRESTRLLLEAVKRQAPAVVEDLVPGQMKLGEVHRVLQMLLRESVPIRNLAAILEAVGDAADRTRDPSELAEAARQRLARTLSSRYRDAKRRLAAIVLEPLCEERLLARTLEPRPADREPRKDEAARLRLVESIGKAAEKFAAERKPPVLIVAEPLRPLLRRWTMMRLPELAVLSWAEITSDTLVDVAETADDLPETAGPKAGHARAAG